MRLFDFNLHYTSKVISMFEHSSCAELDMNAASVLRESPCVGRGLVPLRGGRGGIRAHTLPGGRALPLVAGLPSV